MTLQALEARVMFQTNNDFDDLSEYQPHVGQYLNEGYDLLVHAFTGNHLTDDQYLAGPPSQPDLLPEWSHYAIADYATWLVYRNSNPVKQQRGMQYLQAFNQVLGQLRAAAMKGKQFYNVD